MVVEREQLIVQMRADVVGSDLHVGAVDPAPGNGQEASIPPVLCRSAHAFVSWLALS